MRLSGRWLPAKKLQLAASTYRGYECNVQRHIVPALGRIGLRRRRPHHIEALYDRLLTPASSDPASHQRRSMRSSSGHGLDPTADAFDALATNPDEAKVLINPAATR